MATITVMTPTYNRRHMLENLYKSLCGQSCLDFEWLVIDDGSTDDTESLLREWIAEKRINMRYITKPNGGKHTAINVGVQHTDSPLTFIVDSDDTITPDAIATVCADYSRVNWQGLCGLSYIKQNKNGQSLATKDIPEQGLREDFVTCRYRRNIMGDMAEVWLTKCLKEYPFPEYEGERFLGEGTVWIPMAAKYQMVFYNKVIYLADYLPDGLTRNRAAVYKKSPRGVMHLGEVHLDAKLPIKYRLRAMMYYHVYGKAAGLSSAELFSRSKHKALFVLMWLPCWGYYDLKVK